LAAARRKTQWRGDPDLGRRAGGKRAANELDRRASSLMPEGLENALTREEFQDLLAFLQSLR